MKNKLRSAVVIRNVDNLNKQNFWDIAKEICPLAIEDFCKWIDQYKKVEHYIPDFDRSLHWDALFGNIWPTAHPIKFHHLPLEMQVGIIFRFLGERIGPYRDNLFDIFLKDNWIDIICESFMFLEDLLKHEKNG